MCGRFTLFSSPQEISDRFNIEQLEIKFEPRFNIAPSQQILAIVNDGKQNKIGHLKWGLVPSWAKDPAIGNKMINARAETLAEKPSFRDAYRKRRCLIVTDGFYEWKNEKDGKIPQYIYLQDKQPFAFAGLWERWVSPEGQEITSCTIVTTESNEFMSPIHHRMPVILTPETEGVWLNRDITDVNILSTLLQPYPTDEMNAYPVSTCVGIYRFRSLHC